jgi:hypothetical protein
MSDIHISEPRWGDDVVALEENHSTTLLPSSGYLTDLGRFSALGSYHDGLASSKTHHC